MNQLFKTIVTVLSLSVMLTTAGCFKKTDELSPTTAAVTNPNLQPYRSFITIQHYNMESSGNTNGSVSEVKLQITFPNGSQLDLPEGGQYWPIGNGQVQEINRTFEVPWQYIQNDGLRFTIQMVRKDSPMLPCKFVVEQLSEYNRAYVCRTDTAWQKNHRRSEEEISKEGVQIRVFSDRNMNPKEIPSDAIALR